MIPRWSIIALFSLFIICIVAQNKPFTSVQNTLSYKDSIQNAFDKKNIQGLEKLIQKLSKTPYSDTLAIAYRRLGAVCQHYGKKDSALSYALKAQSVIEKNGVKDTNIIAPTYHNIGAYYSELNSPNLDSAEFFLKKALTLREKQGNTEFALGTTAALANVYRKRYDYGLIQDFEETYTDFLTDNIKADFYNAFAICNRDKGQLYPNKLDSAIRQFHWLADYYHEKANTSNEALSLKNLGTTFGYKKQSDSALLYLNQALTTIQKSSIPDKNTERDILCDIGWIYLKKQNFAAAEKYYKQGLKLKHSPQEAALMYDNLGAVYSQQKQFEKGLMYFQKALNTHLTDFTNEKIETLPPLSILNKSSQLGELLEYLGDKATCWQRYYYVSHKNAHLKQALRTYLVMDTVARQFLRQLHSEDSKLFYSEKFYPLYDSALTCVLKLYGLAETTVDKDQYLNHTLRFLQSSKATVLREALADGAVKKFAGLPPSVLERENQLKQKIATLSSQVWDSTGTQHATQKALMQAKEALHTFQRDTLENQYPRYYNLKYLPDNSSTVANIQQSLDSNQLFLEYFMSEQHIYTLAVCKNKAQLYSSVLPTYFNQSWETFAKIAQNHATTDTEQQTLAQAAHQLYQILLEKPLAELNADKHITRLNIIPNAQLQQLPFDALKKQASTMPSDFVAWDYAVTYAYSHDLMLQQKTDSRAATYSFGGFGINYTGIYKNVFGNKKLSPLKNAETDVIQTAKLFGSAKTYIESDNASTKQHFLDNAAQFKVLYCSMHGVSDKDHPQKSALIFIKKDSLDPLTAADLYGVNLNQNELTMLSACETGAGIAHRTEGVISLARAFFYSGVPCLVMSLWSINERATSKISQFFFENLAKGMTKDVALQEAKKSLMTYSSEYSKPYSWAAFSLMGQPSAIKADYRQNNHLGFWLLGLVGAGTVVFLLRKKRRNL